MGFKKMMVFSFQYIQPLISLGYHRTIESDDLYSLPHHQSSSILSAELLKHLQIRIHLAQSSSHHLKSHSSQSLFSIFQHFQNPISKLPSLALAISDTFFLKFWSAGLFKLLSDGLSVCSPFVTKALIQYGQDSYDYAHSNDTTTTTTTSKPNPTRAYALAIGLVLMQIGSSICMHQYFYRSMSVGVLARSALISSLYRHSLSLNHQSRRLISTSQLITHISTDVSRIDFCLGFFHLAWTSSIQLIAIIIILLLQIGVSSLAGLAIMILLLSVCIPEPQTITIQESQVIYISYHLFFLTF